MRKAVSEQGSYHHFYGLLKVAEQKHAPLEGVGASLGCGVSWLESDLLSKRSEIEQMYLVEMSEHRIFELSPIVLDSYGIDESRVRLCAGSFYDVRLEDHTLDFLILYAAFHHADDVDRLLTEMRRLLKPDGVVLIAGEHYFGPRAISNRALGHLARYVLDWKGYRAGKRLFPSWNTLVPISEVKGDRHRPLNEYRRLFSKHGFDHMGLINRNLSLRGFVLSPRPSNPEIV